MKLDGLHVVSALIGLALGIFVWPMVRPWLYGIFRGR